MDQHQLQGITGRTELGLNEYIETRPAYEDHGPAHTLHTWRTYTIQAQEDAHLFHLTEQFWNEATDRYCGDIPNDAPAEWPLPGHDAALYVPCEQACVTLVNTYWPLDDDTPVLTFTEVTCFDIDSQPVPFEALPIGTEIYDPFTKDMVRKVSALRGIVLASDAREQPGATYGFTDCFAPMKNTVYPVLPPSAQHLADGWVPEPLATDPPQDHPEGWNASSQACMAAYAKDPNSVEVLGLPLDGLPQAVYPLPPSSDAPETQGIPVTYKVAMGNCYRLYHHGRQIAIVPNYAQGEVIAQALAATFAGRLADFSMTLDFIEGATP